MHEITFSQCQQSANPSQIGKETCGIYGGACRYILLGQAYTFMQFTKFLDSGATILESAEIGITCLVFYAKLLAPTDTDRPVRETLSPVGDTVLLQGTLRVSQMLARVGQPLKCWGDASLVLCMECSM